MDVLIHISQQLSNSTTTAYSPAEFTISPGIVVVNVLFFLSLALVLIDAFLAMLVKSWIQEFDRAWRNDPRAKFRAQEREQRVRSLERWKLAQLVALLPILIQTALLFFCIGLIVLLYPIHLISAIFSLVALVAGLTFYWFTTYVCIFDPYAPFSSPVSRGLRILINKLQTIWLALVHLIAHCVTSGIPFRTSHSSSPREHEASTDPATQSLPGDNRVAHSLPRGTVGVEKQETITRPPSKIDPQTYVNILERLVTTTAEAVENIPVFLLLLDQPVNDPTVRPSNIKKWKELLHTTLGLLGDPSTFSASITRTITHSVLLCYDGGSADQQLVRSLIHQFDRVPSGQDGKHRPLDSFFAPYLRYYCGVPPIDLEEISDTIVALEPSNAADAELLWLVNTIHHNLLWKHYRPTFSYNFGIFAAVLTYVSCTEQSRRSQVPFTAAIIDAMHTLKSTIDKGGIHLKTGPRVLPETVLTTSESMSRTFHQVDALDLWSKDCVELASALLQPHTHWPMFEADGVWKFQLALIAALYIDSTKQVGQPPTAFAHLLRLAKIPETALMTWGWADAYDQTKLAGYCYMVLFQEPLYQEGSKNSPVHDIGYIIMQTIKHCSEIRLPALHLLDFSVKYLCGRSTLSNMLTMDPQGDLRLKWADADGSVINYAYGPFNPWILLHLDTLFSPSSTLHQKDLKQIEWTGTPEEVHIAMARLALYNSLHGTEHKETRQLKPEPDVLKLFLKSNDYEVCTSVFVCCLNLASQLSSAGDIQSAGTFMTGTMGCQWIEHLIRVLCGTPWHETSRSWLFLTEHVTPKWGMLPYSWCREFASAFLFLNVHILDEGELPPYQWFAKSLKDEEQTNQTFLPFLGTMLELFKYRLTLHQVDSFDIWLAQLPKNLENQDAHVKLDNILATRRQEIVNETLRCFAELPMTYPE